MNVIAQTHFQQALEPSPFTGFYEAVTTRAHWTAWNGYKVAKVVDNLAREYFAIRSGCSVMDLTPMEKYRVSGPDALAFLDRLLVRRIDRLRIGRITYVAWCDDEGKLMTTEPCSALASRTSAFVPSTTSWIGSSRVPSVSTSIYAVRRTKSPLWPYRGRHPIRC